MMVTSAAARVDNIRRSMVGLKMPRALEMLDATLRRIEQGQIDGVEAIDDLLTEELSLRETRRIRAALRMARLPIIKTLEGFDFSFQPSLDRNRIMALAGLDFISRAEVLHLLGPPGTGKSQVSIAAPGLMPRGRARSTGFDEVIADQTRFPGCREPGLWCRHEPGRFGYKDPERSADRLVTVKQPTRSGRADGARVT
jgi:hypothetical protein